MHSCDQSWILGIITPVFSFNLSYTECNFKCHNKWYSRPVQRFQCSFPIVSKSFTPSSIALVKRLNCSHFCSLKATRQHWWTSPSRGCSLLAGRQSWTSKKSASGWSHQLELVKLTKDQANNHLGPAKVLKWAVGLTLQSGQGLAVPQAL